MKKVLAISLIAIGTLASVGAASAASPIYTDQYVDWAVDAFRVGDS